MRNTALFVLFFVCSTACYPASAGGDTHKDIDEWFTFIWENDFIADDDSGYTNGLGFIWGQQSFDQSRFAVYQPVFNLLPQFNRPKRRYGVSYRMAQTMFTPDDIEEPQLIEDDRPYAGMLVGSLHLQSFNDTQSWHYSGALAIVGPASGAEPVQKFIHEIIGVNQPEGWSNQLHNELAFMVSGEFLQRLNNGSLGKREYDWILLTGADLGTLHSELGAGIGFRYGSALSHSFPCASLIPGRTLNPLASALHNQWHLYINLYGRYVFNDLAIEGNTFKNSHGVTLTHPQALISMGWVYNTTNWGMTLSVQESTRTFEERRENTLFGTFAITFRY